MLSPVTELMPGVVEGPNLDAFYPSFFEAEVPPGTSAIRAWQGILQPFRNDLCACEMLRAFEADRAVTSDQGFLSAAVGFQSFGPHWAEPYLVAMQRRFHVMVLDFPPPHHPFAFSLRPAISNLHFPAHPHLRRDWPLLYGRTNLHALCIYSAPFHSYAADTPRIVQFVDQLSAYLGKHLIWEKTRMLFSTRQGELSIVYKPRPREPIVDIEPRYFRHKGVGLFANSKHSDFRFWSGFWPGLSAFSAPSDHLRHIQPAKECWCGNGLPYGECHRLKELAKITSLKI
jgi:hypothetical protein